MKAKMHYFSNLFDKVCYMFRTGPLSIIWSNIKSQKDIGWVRQNTTLYYGVRCPKGTTCFGPLL